MIKIVCDVIDVTIASHATTPQTTMIKLTMTAERVEIICSPDTLFPEYSCAIEQGFEWFFGRGIAAFKAERSKDPATREQLVTLTALTPGRSLAFSLVTPLGDLAADNYWPEEIPFDKVWQLPGVRHEIRDGQHRLFRANKEGTIIQQYGMDKNLPIGMLAYGLSDLITGFFWQGAKWVKYQSSLGLTQTMTDKGLRTVAIKSTEI